MIVDLHRRNLDAEAVSLVKWFGSYLLWSEVDPSERDGWRRQVVVRHLRGRKMPAPSLGLDLSSPVI